MRHTVRAVLINASGGLSAYPLIELAELITSLGPDNIVLAFYQGDHSGNLVGIKLTFVGDVDKCKTTIFRDALLHADIELGFEVVFPPEDASTQSQDYSFVSVTPLSAELPSGKPVAFSLPLLNAAIAVFRQANFLHIDVAYEVHLARRSSNIEAARSLIPALAELRAADRNPEVGDCLAHSIELARSNGWYALERLGIPSKRAPIDGAWVESMVKEHVRKLVPFLPGELIQLEWRHDAPTATELSIQEYIGQARTADYVERISESVSESLSASGRSLAGLLSASLLASKKRTTRTRVTADFAFISYAHSDIQLVASLAERVEQFNVHCWYDQRLTAGDIWDEELERRIFECRVFVACVSDNYGHSRYCRRELKYADLIGKKILPISNGSWTWPTGLRMMFQDLQVATVSTSNDLDAFCRLLSEF